MSECRTIRELCSIVVDCPHSTPTWTSEGKIVVRNNNIKNGRIDLSSPSYTDEEHFSQRVKRAVPQPGDLIITREAPIGDVGMIPEGVECCLGQRMVLLRADPSICDSYYLLYSLQSRWVQHQISWSEGTGTTVSNLRIPHLEQIKIPYLPLPKQKAIASVLRSLEEKMCNNRKINDNLQQQLSSIFHRIFDKENRDVALGEAISTTSGGTPSRKKLEFYENADVCWVKSKELLGGYLSDTEEHINDLAISKSAAKILPAKSVLIAMYGATVGAYAITSREMTCNQAICALLENDRYPHTYLFQYAKEYQGEIVNLAVGSAQQNISQVTIKQLSVHSDTDKIQRFDEIASPIHRKLQQLELENKYLANLRDSLLPKLMSGEIDVSDVQL